jgi:Domain of unknown function (DUF1772)
MTINYLSAWLMLAFGGLFSGGILIFAVERTNLWRRMPVEQYAVDFRRSLYRVDPLLPILGAVSAVGAVLFALNNGGRAAVLAWIGISLIAAVMIGSVVIAEPINSKFRRLSEGRAPEGAEQLRVTWRRFHLARTAVALAAFACLAAAVA